ncbi:hypothetical protein QOZ80_6AG0535010 [Eleusine coracana subsp. coracana]|nr:hypothetical protein QOZ80_6AG0535010 [Eleusine coracana subsp. coracana]
MGHTDGTAATELVGERHEEASFPPAPPFPYGGCVGDGRLEGLGSLVPELMDLVAARVLAADVVDYMALRAVCARWRASSPSPRDPTLRDPRLRPHGWVALCDGNGVRLADACEATTAVRVLHPFTRVVVDLPPIAPVFDHMVEDQQSRAWMKAAVCASEVSSDSIAVVAWFPIAPGVVVAEPTLPFWHVVSRDIELAAAVPFQGRLYGVIGNQRQVVQLYPQCQSPCIADIPNTFGIPQTNAFFLVESAARLMLILRHFFYCKGSNGGYGPCRFAMFEVDTVGHQGLVPVSSLGDRALFLTPYRCLSVSQNDMPSICANAIYFRSGNADPVSLYSVSSETFEQISTLSIIHDLSKRIRPSVRPFTLADHLLIFCNHRQWSRGLMFHEYHCIPRSRKKLFKKLKAQDREVQIPGLDGSSSRSE